MKSRQHLLLVLALIGIGVCSRLLPHPPNFTPVGAIALLGGTYIKDKRLAFSLPLVILFISDLFISGLHSQMPFVYLSFLIITALGRVILANRVSTFRVLGTSLLGSILFFIITNLGCWWLSYEHSVAGFLLCFTLALPFFTNTILGDLFFVSLFFVSYFLVSRKLKLLANVE
ncbi:MAG: DUF6580 family putative transport protein [Bacteroidia bacterium]|nr:DUF6580 family putative transport protein [Bacteroidia bacterium]